MNNIRVHIAGGGTGGHLFPALAVAQELRNRGVRDIEFFGTSFGPEARIVPANGYKLNRIWIKGYPRKLKPEVLLLPLKIKVSIIQCLSAMLRFKPDVLLATGGYVCLPFMLAGKILGKPLIIHEQNSLPGITTRIGARWADTLFYSFPHSAKHFTKHKDCRLSGNPVRSGLGELNKSEALNELRLDSGRKTILVFGGSQGAKSINNAVSEIIDDLTTKYNLIWQTGRGNRQEINLPRNVITAEFFDNIGLLYSAADLAVCRSGAMTLAELAAVGLPAILIPFPYAAEDHQRINAEPIAEAGAAKLLLDKELNGAILLNTIQELFSDSEAVEKMSQKIKEFHHPDAAALISARIIEIAERKDAHYRI